MSTTGNEYEEPGVNYPDRKDADGAADTPKQGEPTRENEAARWRPGGCGRHPGSGRRRGRPRRSVPAPGRRSPATTPSASASSTTSRTPRATTTARTRAATRSPRAQRSARATLDDAQEQRLPAMSQNNASEIDKVAGIVAQTRNDLAATEPERVPDVLRQRLEQAGIDLPDAEIEELARQITIGDA